MLVAVLANSLSLLLAPALALPLALAIEGSDRRLRNEGARRHGAISKVHDS
jgi:hypothetical protein